MPLRACHAPRRRFLHVQLLLEPGCVVQCNQHSQSILDCDHGTIFVFDEFHKQTETASGQMAFRPTTCCVAATLTDESLRSAFVSSFL